MVPDFRASAALHRAAVDGDKLANLVVIANLKTSRFASVGDVLRRHSDGSEREKAVVPANLCGTFNGNVRNQMAALAELDIRPNDTVRTDLAGGMKTTFRIDHRRRMNGHG